MTDAHKPLTEQLLLNLPIKEAFAEEDFLPSHSNEEAIKWIDKWPAWNLTHTLILYGPSGCGKTHLSHVWQNITGAKLLDLACLKADDYTDQEEFVFIIENVMEHLKTQATQENLLHLYNWTKEQGGYLLLTAQEHPKNWSMSLADLSSRMLSSGAVKIKTPDDNLLQAVIIKQFSDRQIMLSEKVLSYIIKNTERSFAAIRKLVRAIDQISMAEKKKITIAIVKRALAKDDID